MSKEEVIEEGQEGKKSGKGLIIVLLVVVILLLVGMGIMAFLLMSGHDKDATTDSTEMHASVEHGDDNPDEDASVKGHAKSYSPEYKQFEPPAPEAAPSYFVMDKFVVNFNGEGKAKFLAVDLQFMSYYVDVVGADGEMEHFRPILKNDIQRLLRNQRFTDLDKPDGPDHLRAEILEVARKVLEKHKVYPDLIEDVYMTRFVMQ